MAWVGRSDCVAWLQSTHLLCTRSPPLSKGGRAFFWIPLHAGGKLPMYEFWAVYGHSFGRCTSPRKICIPCLSLTKRPKSCMGPPCKNPKARFLPTVFQGNFTPTQKFIHARTNTALWLVFGKSIPFIYFTIRHHVHNLRKIPLAHPFSFQGSEGRLPVPWQYNSTVNRALSTPFFKNFFDFSKVLIFCFLRIM